MSDDRVGAWPEARTEEDVLDIAAAHALIVDVISRGAVTRQRALDSDLAILAPLAGSLAVAVIKHKFD